MSTPYRFTPRVPAPPHSTPSSVSAYILPNAKSLRPPITNPYDKFTQPEFDAWIGNITGALRHALGQDEEEPTEPVAEKTDATGKGADRYPHHKPVDAEESDDEAIDDSFADFKARRAGKGKARDPREGPGLGKGDISRPIHIVSSDEEEEEEVELSMMQLDDESEEEDEEGDEYSEEEEYTWEKGQSSSQPIPLERPRKRREVQEEEAEEVDDEEYEVDEEEYEAYEEEAVGEEAEEEAEFEEYDEEEYDEYEEDERPRRSSPKVIELISDDEDEIQPPLASKWPGKEKSPENEEEYKGELEGEEEYGPEEYVEYSGEEAEVEKEDFSPEARAPPVGGPASPVKHVISLDDQAESVDYEDDVEAIEPSDIEPALPPKWRKSAMRQSRVEIPDPWEGPRTFAEDFYSGGDVHVSAGDQVDPSHLGLEDEDIGRGHTADYLQDGVEVLEATPQDEIQPISNDTSFPPNRNSSPAEQQRDVEISDPWTGPRQYAEDFYSGGSFNLTPGSRVNPDHLGPQDSQYIDVDAEEEVLEEEIVDEVQPLNVDESFPPHEVAAEASLIIADRWAGPQMYAEDFYSGGDVRTMPGQPIDPSFLSGTGNLDDSIDAFLTPGALSPSQSERISMLADEVDEAGSLPERFVPVPSKCREPIPADAEFISIDDSDDEEKAQETEIQNEHPVPEVLDIGGDNYQELYSFEVIDESDVKDSSTKVEQNRKSEPSPPVEHGDRFKELSQEDLQSFYIEGAYYESDSSEEETCVSDVKDGSLPQNLPEVRPGADAIALSPESELPVADAKYDVVSIEPRVEAELATIDLEPSSNVLRNDYLHPTEVIEADISHEKFLDDALEVSTENGEIHVESVSVIEGHSVITTLDVTSPAADTSLDNMSVDANQDVEDIEVSAHEEITDVGTEIPKQQDDSGVVANTEMQAVDMEKELISVDNIDTEPIEPETEPEEPIPEAQVQETADLVPDDLPHEALNIEGVSDSTVHPAVQIDDNTRRIPPSAEHLAQEITDEESELVKGAVLSADAAEIYSATYTAFEVYEFSEEDADGEIDDDESEIISIATASDMQERRTSEEDEYTIEEPMTEGRRTEEPPERAASLRVLSVEPEVAAAVDHLAEHILDQANQIFDEVANELMHTPDKVAAAAEDVLDEVSAPEPTLQEEQEPFQKIVEDESKGITEINHVKGIEAAINSVVEITMDTAAVEIEMPQPVPSELGTSELSEQPTSSILTDVLSPTQPEETAQQTVSVSALLAPSPVEIASENAPLTDGVQETSGGAISSPSNKTQLRKEVSSAIDRAFFSPTLPNYFGDLNVASSASQLPPSDLGEWLKTPTTVSATTPTVPPTSPPAIPVSATPSVPTTVEAAGTEAVLEAAQISDAAPVTVTLAAEVTPVAVSSDASMSSVIPMSVTLTRPRMPVLVSDPYPYSLSTPYGAYNYILPESGSEEDTGFDNSISSNSTLEQEKDKKTAPGPIEDTDDLEFQYPPEHEVIEELKNAGLPLSILQPSKVDTSALVAEVTKALVSEASTSSAHLDENNITTLTAINTIPVMAEPATLSTKLPGSGPALPAVETKKSNGVSLPTISLEEVEHPPPPAKTSSKRSQKRKRDTSPGPGNASTPVGPKSKGKRSSKSERKGKAQELKETVPEPTSEETIRVRPRPKTVDQPSHSDKPTESVPPLKLLHNGDRASSIASSAPSDASAGMQQPSPTVSKPNKPIPIAQTMPIASLFHAHGKGKKQPLPLPTFRPKSVKLILPEPPSEPVASTSRVSKQDIPTVASIPDLPKNNISDGPAPPATTESVAVTPTLTTPSPPKAAIDTASTAPAGSSSISDAPLTSSPVSATPAINPETPTHVAPTTPADTPTQQISHRARPGRMASMTSSPVTRSHCKYHRISLPKEEGGPRVCFLVPGCSLNDKELMEEEEIEDHGDATVADSYRMIKDIDSLGFHSDLIGILRQLVGLDILREQEVFYLPAPGEEVNLRKNPVKKTLGEKPAMIRVPAETSSNAGSPAYSGGFPLSPGSWKAATPLGGSDTASVTGRRSFVGSEKGSSFMPSDTERGLSDGEEPETKRARPSPPGESLSMGPPPLAQSKGKSKRDKSKPNRSKPKGSKAEGGTAEGAEADKDKEKDGRKPRKSMSSTKRGVKRSRTSEVIAGEGEERSPKKLKAHSTASTPLSSPAKSEKPPSSTS
ncbi:hypothetical protein BDN70DRAFT_988313 [Pholiota conissans]|uniref:Uncharacterized protein n=1 Tax=Pholiota conissans TaxID=109636 RepID=A0A9P6D6V4_9AGAR|nr:hypothetical protein BDN70DRAFT_988313 [Pholiota conissans]